MTVGILLQLLQQYHQDQHVFINLRTEDYPEGFSVKIQGVRAIEPEGDEPDRAKWFVALEAHEQNLKIDGEFGAPPEHLLGFVDEMQDLDD